MARKNATSYVERHAANIRDGVSPEIAKDEPAKSDLDSPEVQSAILRPETVVVPLDGESVTLPTQITLGQAFEIVSHEVVYERRSASSC